MKNNPPNIIEKERKFFTKRRRKKFDSADVKQKGIKTPPLKISKITNRIIEITLPVWFH